MTTNILKALLNIKKYGDNDLSKIITSKSSGQPSVNLVGEPLDYFIRDALCDTFNVQNILEKKDSYDEEFSYYGSQNHPPDIVVKNSDAVEIKKVGPNAKEIQLNSSYPKSKLKCDCHLITQECVECEPGWTEKDIVYAVGHVSKNKVNTLTLVYGDCYAANTDIYRNLREKLIEEIKSIQMPFSKTNELGRLNEIDPLKITKLRIRGMFIIKSPLHHFKQHIKSNKTKNLSVFCIMKKERFVSFPDNDKEKVSKEMDVSDIKIKNPDNPENELDAKLITFSF